MKILGAVLGVVVALVGVGLLLGGVLIRTSLGPNGEIGTDVQLFGTESRGFVTRTLDLGSIEQVPLVDLGDLDLTLDVAAVRADTFIGVGPTAEVDAYLDGVDVEKIDSFELDPFALDTTRSGGEVVPAPPLTLDFWSTSVVVTGEEPVNIELDLSEGSQRLVIMNADASPDVSIDADLTVDLPFLSTLAWVLIVIGALLLVIGVALIVSSARAASNQNWLPEEGPGRTDERTWSTERWDVGREDAARRRDPSSDPFGSGDQPPPHA
ncbi:MAG: hypothetical protein AAFZ07_26620 [Actinomycetota bacterium]